MAESNDDISKPLFVAWLKNELENTDLTQSEIAGRALIRQSYLSMLANGKRTPSRNVIIALADVFGVNPETALVAAGAGTRPRTRGKSLFESMRLTANQDVDMIGSVLWAKLLERSLPLIELPAEISLLDIEAEMKRLKALTERDKKMRGACIVFNRGHKLQLIHHVVGRLEGVEPVHRSVDFEDHLGFFYTHPNKFEEAGTFGFSDTDYLGIIEGGDRLSIVLSGDQVYVVVRTDRTPHPQELSEAEERAFLEVFMRHMTQIARSADTHARRIAEQKANFEMCRKLNLAFYTGQLGHIQRKEEIS